MKLLKLAGLDSYLSPLTKLNRVAKGEVIAVEDSVADHMLEGVERKYDMDLPHWEVVAEGTPANYSFVEGFAVAPIAPVAPKVDPVMADLEEADRILAAEAVPAAPAAPEEVAEVPAEDGTESAPKSQRVVRTKQ